jgi:hypothetical protein
VDEFGDVHVCPGGKEAAEKAELPDRKDVPDKAQNGRGSTGGLIDPSGDLADRADRNLDGKRGVLCGASGVFSNQEERISGPGHIQIGVLGTSGEIEEIDSLGDQSAVDPHGTKLTLKAADALIDFRCRDVERFVHVPRPSCPGPFPGKVSLDPGP